MMETELLLASNNAHKHQEFIRLFAGTEILTPREIGVEFAFEEDGGTFLDNAFGKAMTLFHLAKRPVIADDSGLCVRALGGSRGCFPPATGQDRAGCSWMPPGATPTSWTGWRGCRIAPRTSCAAW